MRPVRRWGRRFGATVGLLVVLLGALAPLPAGGRVGQSEGGPPETPDGNAAIDDLVGCVQGSRRLLVLFLMDESASLKQFDPENRRVDAAQGALDSLVALASGDGEASPSVEVAFAAFANEYRQVRGWTEATDETAEDLTGSLAEFAELNDGIDTDFVNALTGGREALADRAAEITSAGGATPCRAILLFTDGGYDLALRPDQEAIDRLGATKPYAPGIELTSPERVIEVEAAGRAALCEPDGLADRLRTDDVTLLTVALSGEVARRSQLPLAAASAGSADDYTCGTPTDRPTGAYLPAEDIDVLITRFNEVGTRLAGGNALGGDEVVAICGSDDEACDEGSRTFEVDPTLRRIQLVALAPEPGSILVVQGPNGGLARVSAAGPTQVGSVPARARSIAGRGVALELDRPADDADWSGTWRASLVDPTDTRTGTPGRIQVFLFSDLVAQLGPPEPLRRGTPTELQALLVAPDGVDPADVVAQVEAVVRLEDPVTGEISTVPLDGPPTGPFTGTFSTPSDLTVNALVATAELRIETTSGARIVSQSPTAELLVRRPEGAIQFTPPSLAMASLTGLGTTDAVMQVSGGAADGCIWFGPTQVADPPDGIGSVEVTVDGSPLPAEADCLSVPADGRLALTIAASPEARASGTVRGTLEIYEQVEGAAEASVTQVPFRFDLARGVDETRRLLLTVLLLLAGLGLPMVALLVINALTARFQALDAVRATALPVVVSGRTVSRDDGPYPRALALREGDFGSLAGSGSVRRFRFGGIEFRARASRNPFGATMAMAVPEGGAEKLKGKAGSRVELDVGLAGSWVFLLDPNRTRAGARGDVHGLLIAFVAEGEVSAQTERMLPDIAERLPTTAARLAGLVREAARKPRRRKASARSEADAPAGDASPNSPSASDEPATVEQAGEVERPVASPTGAAESAPVAAGVSSEGAHAIDDAADDDRGPDDEGLPGSHPDGPDDDGPDDDGPVAPLGFGGPGGPVPR